MQAHALAYNLQDLTSALLDDLGDSSFSTTRLRRYFNSAQKKIFSTHHFKFCEKAVTGSLTVGEYTFEQQDNHEATIGGVLVHPTQNTTYWELTLDNYLGHRDFFERYPDPSVYDNGMPRHWTEFGDQIYFDRPVDLAYIFKQRYYRIPNEMESDGDVPEVPSTFRDLLEYWALYRAEKYRGNHDIAATWKQDFEDDLEAMAIRYSSVTAMGPTIQRQTRRRV